MATQHILSRSSCRRSWTCILSSYRGVCELLDSWCFYPDVCLWVHNRQIYKYFTDKQTCSALLLLAGSLPVFMLDGMRVHSASFVYRWTRIYICHGLFCLFLRFYFHERNQCKMSRQNWPKGKNSMASYRTLFVSYSAINKLNPYIDEIIIFDDCQAVKMCGGKR